MKTVDWLQERRIMGQISFPNLTMKPENQAMQDTVAMTPEELQLKPEIHVKGVDLSSLGSMQHFIRDKLIQTDDNISREEAENISASIKNLQLAKMSVLNLADEKKDIFVLNSIVEDAAGGSSILSGEDYLGSEGEIDRYESGEGAEPLILGEKKHINLTE